MKINLNKIVVTLFFSIYMLLIGRVNGQASNFITLKEKQFIDENGNLFYPMVCNYDLQFFHDENSSATPPPIYISPTPQFHGTTTFDCHDLNSCNQEFITDFQEMKDMHFNTVRIIAANGWGLIPTFNQNSAPNFNDGMDFYINGNIRWGAANAYNLHFTPQEVYSPDLSNYKWQLILGAYSQITEAAAMVTGDPLKIIWVLGNDKEFYNQQNLDLFKEFIKIVSNHLKSYTNILAYDIKNEPGNWGNYPGNPSKTWVCETFNEFYDILKVSDPNHLITLGGFGAGDVITYDPNLLKIDFYSLHVYPIGPEFGLTNFNDQWNSVLGHIYWLSRACNKPYIIGETGFRSLAGYGISDGFDGDLSEMSNFMENCLNAMNDCGYSGFSWWWFQDYTDPSIVPDHYYGILGSGSAPLSNWRKPAASKIPLFNPYAVPNVCSQPSDYFNPFQYSTSNPLTGSINYYGGAGVNNAYIFGWAFNHDFNGFRKQYKCYTFIDENDFSFKFYKKANVNPQTTTAPYFGNIRISSPGSSVVSYGSWTHPVSQVPSGQTYTLSEFNFEYDESVNNKIIPIQSAQIFKGYNSLSVSNIIVEGYGNFYGNLELIARNEINVQSEFHAMNGSKLHIYCDNTWMDCPEVVNYNRLHSDFNSIEGVIPQNQIEISFNLNGKLGIEVYPNPSKGNFTIVCSDDIHLPLHYSIFNAYGAQIEKGIFSISKNLIALGDEPPGIYLLSILTNNEQIIVKLINQ